MAIRTNSRRSSIRYTIVILWFGIHFEQFVLLGVMPIICSQIKIWEGYLCTFSKVRWLCSTWDWNAGPTQEVTRNHHCMPCLPSRTCRACAGLYWPRERAAIWIGRNLLKSKLIGGPEVPVLRSNDFSESVAWDLKIHERLRHALVTLILLPKNCVVLMSNKQIFLLYRSSEECIHVTRFRDLRPPDLGCI